MALRLSRAAAKNLILMQENCKSIDLGKQATLPETHSMKATPVLLAKPPSHLNDRTILNTLLEECYA